MDELAADGAVDEEPNDARAGRGHPRSVLQRTAFRLTGKITVDASLWKRIEALVSAKSRRSRSPSRKLLDDRQAMNGILFVLHTGVAWRYLPQELAYGSG
jgi:hypothetical protein